MPRDRAKVEVELYRPSVEFWIVPDDAHGQWVTVSRHEGKLHVRGTYVDATPSAARLAQEAYLAMERAFLAFAAGRPPIRVRVKS